MDDLITGGDGLSRPAWAAHDPLLREYYDTEWGMPVSDERGVFERISLEAFQAGLSWRLILSRREAFRAAFSGFDPEVVADLSEADIERLAHDASIIRNRAKIAAAIGNAKATLALRAEGGLAELVWSYRPSFTPVPHRLADIPSSSPESIALAKELKRRNFRFVGPTITFALMEAIGIVDTHLVGSHRRGCSGLWRPDGTMLTA